MVPPGRNSSIVRNISATLLGEGEPDEPPILEELGINFSHIYRKTLMVLAPRRSKLDQEVINDSDFAGPMIFCLVLATLLLLKGKVYFGYIYGVFMVGLCGMWGVLHLMSAMGIDIYRAASLMGYCLLPLDILAARPRAASAPRALIIYSARSSTAWTGPRPATRARGARTRRPGGLLMRPGRSMLRPARPGASPAAAPIEQSVSGAAPGP